MKRRIMQLGIMTLLSSNVHAGDHESIAAVDQLMTQLASANKRKKESLNYPTESELYPLHTTSSQDMSSDQRSLPTISRRASIFEAFKRFVQIFLILLNNHRTQTSIKTVDGAIINLVQIALQALKINTTNLHSNDQRDVAQQLLADPSLKSSFVITLSTRASAYNPMPTCRNKTYSPCLEKAEKELDRTALVVLNNFALIASNFINILQDPENSEIVTPNLIGMLERILTIGKEVIRNGHLSAETNEQEIIAYVEQLDPEFKEQLICTIHRTVQRSYHL